jgi:hypothetical protein
VFLSSEAVLHEVPLFHSSPMQPVYLDTTFAKMTGVPDNLTETPNWPSGGGYQWTC